MLLHLDLPLRYILLALGVLAHAQPHSPAGIARPTNTLSSPNEAESQPVLRRPRSAIHCQQCHGTPLPSPKVGTIFGFGSWYQVNATNDRCARRQFARPRAARCRPTRRAESGCCRAFVLEPRVLDGSTRSEYVVVVVVDRCWPRPSDMEACSRLTRPPARPAATRSAAKPKQKVIVLKKHVLGVFRHPLMRHVAPACTATALDKGDVGWLVLFFREVASIGGRRLALVAVDTASIIFFFQRDSFAQPARRRRRRTGQA